MSPVESFNISRIVDVPALYGLLRPPRKLPPLPPLEEKSKPQGAGAKEGVSNRCINEQHEDEQKAGFNGRKA